MTNLTARCQPPNQRNLYFDQHNPTEKWCENVRPWLNQKISSHQTFAMISYSCGHTGAKTHWQLFLPQKRVHPTISLRIKNVFRRSFSPRAQNPIQWATKDANSLGTRQECLFWHHESGSRFFFWGGRKVHESGHEFCHEIAPNFSAFLPSPKKSTPNPRHFRGQHPCQFWRFFLNAFSGGSTLACVVAFECQYFWPTKTCNLTISVVGQNPESIDSITWSFQVKNSLQIPSVLAQP